MADIIIRNGRILDGTGNPWFRADVAIQGDIIQTMGRMRDDAPTVIDARDMYVCPGFIDMHAHPDLTIFYQEVEDYKLRQGITTEVGGNCGFTAAPLNPRTKETLQKYTAFLTPPTGPTWKWRTFRDYLDTVRATSHCTNLAPLVGHGTVRIATMGFDQRHPSAQELALMHELVAEAMEAGAFGLSTGLVYVPGTYADIEEIVPLAQTAAQYGGIYATHMRNEGDQLLESIEEAIQIGRRANMPVQISHHKAAGRANHGKVADSLTRLQEARDAGLDITADQYPYTAGSTTLQAILPPWAQEGGVAQVVLRLKDHETRTKILSELLGPSGEVRMGGRWEDIRIASLATEANSSFIGLSIQEISDLRNQEPASLALDLLAEENCAVGMVVFSMAEEDVRTVLAHPSTMIGTDGIYTLGKPHPRVYGTYPRILGRYVRHEGLLTLEEAIRKMTSLPAQKLGLHHKGVLRPGADADVVIFNPHTVIDRATFAEPHQYPVGIEYVLVNGQISVAEGQPTGRTAGRVLARPT